MSTAAVEIDHLSVEAQGLYDRNCFFCHGDPSRLVMKTDNFSVLHDRSPVLEGHLLIYTHLHYGCAGELCADLLEELCEIRTTLTQRVVEIYGAAAYYEHGKAGHCMQYGPEETICHHFHLHILPYRGSIAECLANRFPQIELDDYRKLPSLFDRHGHYLYFEESSGRKLFYPVAEDLESHYLRTLISNASNHPERADWENYQNFTLLQNAKRVLGPHNDLRPLG